MRCGAARQTSKRPREAGRGFPVGGGGLASGAAIAVKQRCPDVTVIGVQAAACAPFIESLRSRRPVIAARGATLADGIAIKRPGTLTPPLITEWVTS